MKKTDWKKKKFATQMVHAGQVPDPVTGAIMTPVYLSSTFVQKTPGVHKGYEYSRTSNPTRTALEDCLAHLEQGEKGFAFASGCAATTTALSLLSKGDHVLAEEDLYGGSLRLFTQVLSRLGIEFSFVDFSKGDFSSSLQKNTKMIWIETPTNPNLKICDIQKISEVAKKKNILLAVDNTFASPYFQTPLSLGADLVVHSTTKYVGGHSDIVGGAIVCRSQKLAEELAFISNSVGAVAGAFDAYMALRSLKTLSLRMERHEANAVVVARFLETHPQVESVLYPGLKSHPQHALACSQMRGFGGVVSFNIKGGIDTAKKFLESLEIFALAESLGGVESLAEHPAIMTHASVSPEKRKKLGITDTFIRLSVGVEDSEDLLHDLETAFRKCF